ncbi:MAG: hypothetical protein JO279_14505 [Verrucomicrobia bacterium]|nr:hypothetical protein [Verrucomicrobiota bacterium]
MIWTDKDAPDRTNKTEAFDPPLIHEQDIERPTTGEEEGQEKREDKEQAPELEEEREAREKTEVVSKEAMLRVPSGQL